MKINPIYVCPIFWCIKIGDFRQQNVPENTSFKLFSFSHLRAWKFSSSISIRPHQAWQKYKFSSFYITVFPIPFPPFNKLFFNFLSLISSLIPLHSRLSKLGKIPFSVLYWLLKITFRINQTFPYTANSCWFYVHCLFCFCILLWMF